MSRATMPAIPLHRPAGLTLVELMVTIALAVLVMLGLVTLMNSIGITNRTQDGMARMQENGRYALERIAADLRAATSQYCTTFGAASSERTATGYLYQDAQRTAWSHYDMNAGVNTGPTGQTDGYLLNPRWMLFGSECTNTTCTPAVNLANRGFDPAMGTGPLATMGIAATNRARGADVLTLRWLDGPGIPVTALTSSELDGTAVQITVADNSATGLGAGAAPNNQIWLSDCSSNEVLRVNATAGNPTMTASGNFNATENDRLLASLDMSRDPRAYNVNRDLRRVTYALRVNDDTDPGRVPADRKVVSLVRIENGTVQELVQGVERLDFLYAVENANGAVSYLTADQVDAISATATGTAGACDPKPAIPVTVVPPSPWVSWTATTDAGCGWRRVRAVEVSMLLNTVTDSAVGDDEQFRYSWLNNGTANTTNAYESPAALGTLRNGLPPYRMLRREFKTLVSLRGYNY